MTLQTLTAGEGGGASASVGAALDTGAGMTAAAS